MPTEAVSNYLKTHHIPYETIKHDIAYTAQELAAKSHVKGREFAKTVIVKVDGRLTMVVEPAYCKLNLEALKKLLGAKTIEIAREFEFKDKIGDCDTGAMPPFGELFHMDVYMAESMKENKEIVCNGGSHAELLRLSYGNFVNLVKPQFIAI